MTREEAIELLSDIRGGFNCFDQMEQQQYHALSEAIEALRMGGEFAKGTNVPNTDVIPITREVPVIHGEIDVNNGTVTYHPVRTNADRIRAMSDEDLAKFIEWSDCPPHDGVCDRDNITCSECWLTCSTI